MTNKKVILAAVLLAPLLFFGAVHAEENTSSNDQTTTQSDTQEKHKTGNEGLTLQQRLEKYKTAVKTRLNTAEKVRIQAKCKASQGNVSRLKGRITGIKTSREHSYDNLESRLKSLDDKLKAKSIDTTEYEKELAELSSMIDTFQTDLAKYEEAVNDLATMDCTTDPDAFKASLETARSLRAQVVKDGKAIHDYLSGTIKPTLQSLKSQLEKTDTEGEGQ